MARRRPGPARKKPLNTFGEAVHRELEASGLFQNNLHELARAVNRSYRTLYAYMTAGETKKIPAETVEALADALKISVDRLRVTTAPHLQLVRDSDMGPPGVEAFIGAHPELEPAYCSELRSLAAKAGPEHFTYEIADSLVRGFRARDRGKGIQRPELKD